MMNDWYWKRVPWFCLLLLCFGQPVSSSENGNPLTVFQEASSAYISGDYGTAIEKFESLRKSGVSAPLLYNLANSYAQNGQSGKAILNYERALRLAPGDSDIRGNLALVREKQGLFQEEKSFDQRFAGFLSLNQWIVLATCAFVVFAVVLLFPVSPGLRRAPRLATAACCLFITAVSVFGAFGRYQHWHDGVVVVPDARLRVSPFESAASIGTIQEGRVLHMEKSKIHGNYFLVEDETGRSGWLAAEAFENIPESVSVRR
ncbi:MAG TPA: tetratricopeptide repeat protein [Desulfocapsa sulfexigens]|nr:tetratricopeptide repeat protein [Desulfocapsa sulfexigens]